MTRSLWSVLAIATCVPASVSSAEYTESADFNPVKALAERGISLEKSIYNQQQVLTEVNNTCAVACSKLFSAFETQITQQGSPEIDHWSKDFWSQQQQAVKPSCIFQPRSADDVAIAILVSRSFNCPFAAKSGGHAAFPGASSVQDGITIDFSLMNDIELTEDKKVAKLGPGNIWFRVYSELEKHELAVIGGRVADIGVGGLTLGGGISFFSGAYGWGCDSVVNYEVVTASGEILHVNYTSYPDLYWALRGGGNNFGLVTRFDLETYPQGQIWAGSRGYDAQKHRSSLIEGFTNFGHAPDDEGAIWAAFLHYEGHDLCSLMTMYHRPVPHPPVFDNFKELDSFADSTKIRSLPDMTLEVNASNPKGLRQMYWTHTFALDASLGEFIIDTFYEEIEPYKSTYEGFLPAAILQVITKTSLSHNKKNGGNPIPLSEEEGPYMNLILAFMWKKEEDDDLVVNVVATIMDKTIAKAKAEGLFHEYIYMNYASQYQDVLRSYGKENYERLVSIAEKYDPERVFQKLQPGYFKFGGAPKAMPSQE